MPMLPQRLHPFIAFCIGFVLFAALAEGTTWVVDAAGLQGMAARQIIIKSAMLVVSLALMVLISRPPPARRVWGLAAPSAPGGWLIGTLMPVAIGGVLGAVATATILGFGFTPMSGLREMGLLRMITIVWFGSTLAEEVFVRGLIQGWMQPVPHPPTPAADIADHAALTTLGSGSRGRVIATGLLFGAMHASLFLNNDARTAATIVVATTLLGFVCAWSRERTGSLVGPLLAHFAFNACSIIGGIAVVILKGFPPNIGPP